ncbi:MAG: hypothetical protein JW787_12130 [Sedimentisphaerales bacterium]|nr:hypothetical protein [Sedimentisphaerales bacterium]
MNKIFENKSYYRKYIIVVVIIFLLITTALVFSLLSQKPKIDPASELLIRQAAAYKLNKDPNNLTDKDFSKIKVLHFAEVKQDSGKSSTIVRMYKGLTELTFLKKFTNLEKLNLSNIRLNKSIPKWMKILERLGIINLEDRYTIDVSPISELKNLKVLDLSGFPIKSLKPLSNLTNLKMLDISETPISNIEPLKKLTNLEQVVMLGCKNITDKQVEDLQKALPNLHIAYLKVIPKNIPQPSYRPMWEFEDYLPESELEDGE